MLTGSRRLISFLGKMAPASGQHLSGSHDRLFVQPLSIEFLGSFPLGKGYAPLVGVQKDVQEARAKRRNLEKALLK